MKLALIALLLSAGASAAPDDLCVWFVCPEGSLAWHRDGGVTFEKLEPKDCVKKGQGTRRQADEFANANVGKHLLLDCKKAKR